MSRLFHHVSTTSAPHPRQTARQFRHHKFKLYRPLRPLAFWPTAFRFTCECARQLSRRQSQSRAMAGAYGRPGSTARATRRCQGHIAKPGRSRAALGWHGYLSKPTQQCLPKLSRCTLTGRACLSMHLFTAGFNCDGWHLQWPLPQPSHRFHHQ